MTIGAQMRKPDQFKAITFHCVDGLRLTFKHITGFVHTEECVRFNCVENKSSLAIWIAHDKISAMVAEL